MIEPATLYTWGYSLDRSPDDLVAALKAAGFTGTRLPMVVPPPTFPRVHVIDVRPTLVGETPDGDGRTGGREQ